jgi:hypothetical protein
MTATHTQAILKLPPKSGRVAQLIISRSGDSKLLNSAAVTFARSADFLVCRIADFPIRMDAKLSNAKAISYHMPAGKPATQQNKILRYEKQHRRNSGEPRRKLGNQHPNYLGLRSLVQTQLKPSRKRPGFSRTTMSHVGVARCRYVDSRALPNERPAYRRPANRSPLCCFRRLTHASWTSKSCSFYSANPPSNSITGKPLLANRTQAFAARWHCCE